MPGFVALDQLESLESLHIYGFAGVGAERTNGMLESFIHNLMNMSESDLKHYFSMQIVSFSCCYSNINVIVQIRTLNKWLISFERIIAFMN